MEHLKEFPVATQNDALKGTYSSKSISTIKVNKIKYLKLFRKAIHGSPKNT